MTQQQIIALLCALDWADIIEQFAGQTHTEIYDKLSKDYPYTDSERLSMAIYQELNG